MENVDGLLRGLLLFGAVVGGHFGCTDIRLLSLTLFGLGGVLSLVLAIGFGEIGGEYLWWFE